MFTTPFRTAILSALPGYVSFIRSITDFRAGIVVEADYTGAARQEVGGWDTPFAVDGGLRTRNTAAIPMGANSGTSQDIIGYALWNAASGGVAQVIGFIGANPPVLGRVTAADNTITADAHGLGEGARVFVLALPGHPLPTGLAENTAYHVLAGGLTANTIRLSETAGGTEVAITTDGTVWVLPYTTLTILPGASPQIDENVLAVDF
jgi:hypothetical protein